jgi:hypothetical protein
MSEHDQSRRDFLKRAGTVAWATPLILTLAAHPASAQAVSCAPAGSGCGSFVEGLGCLPTNPAVMCCGSCEPINDDFCHCVDI